MACFAGFANALMAFFEPFHIAFSSGTQRLLCMVCSDEDNNYVAVAITMTIHMPLSVNSSLCFLNT